MLARKVLWFLVPVAMGAIVASQRQDIMRYARIKQMSYGNGHPENVPVEGRASYPQSLEGTDGGWQDTSGRPAGGTTARDRTAVDPQDPVDDRSPSTQWD